jgi:hypothetical protein
MSLLIKLQSLQSELSTYVDKEGTNTFSHYDYVMLGTILSKIKPSLDKYKLILTATVTQADCKIEFQSNGFYSIGSCKVETILIDSETDERISNCSYGFATDKNGDKALFKSITGARKYGISTLLGLQWDSQDEPEVDTPDLNDVPKKAVPKATPKAKYVTNDLF